MLASSVPTSFPEPFGVNAGIGYINTIPAASQIGIQAGRASLNDGFPPVTFLDPLAGGTPPWGADMNGILNEVTAAIQWQQAGGYPIYNSAFSTAIGGYPNGAVLQASTNNGFWRSTVDNNTTNPDASGANWVPFSFNSVTSFSMTNANVTLTAIQAANPILVITGALTGNLDLIFPANTMQWLVQNNTTGAHTISCKTASGGIRIAVTQGVSSVVWCDGTNMNSGVVGLTQAAADARYAALAGSSSQSFATASLTATSVAVSGKTTQTGTASTSGDLVTWQQTPGLGQSWQNLTGSRYNNTTYTNSTTAEIKVLIVINGSGSGQGVFTLNGIAVIPSIIVASTETMPLSFSVPPGETYNLNLAPDTHAIWLEQR